MRADNKHPTILFLALQSHSLATYLLCSICPANQTATQFVRFKLRRLFYVVTGGPSQQLEITAKSFRRVPFKFDHIETDDEA